MATKTVKNPFPKNKLLTKAFELANHHHRGQERKGGLPYITHPVSVAKALLKARYEADVAAAGLLHDVLEDTGCEYEEMLRAMGPRITRWVVQVTDRDKSVPWKVRKRNYLRFLRTASRPALAVACADKTDNVRGLIEGFKNSGKRFGKQFSGKAKDKVANYENVCRVIARHYPSCPLLADYKTELGKLKLFIGAFHGK